MNKIKTFYKIEEYNPRSRQWCTEGHSVIDAEYDDLIECDDAISTIKSMNKSDKFSGCKYRVMTCIKKKIKDVN